MIEKHEARTQSSMTHCRHPQEALATGIVWWDRHLEICESLMTPESAQFAGTCRASCCLQLPHIAMTVDVPVRGVSRTGTDACMHNV